MVLVSASSVKAGTVATLLGIVSLVPSPRPGTQQALGRCRSEIQGGLGAWALQWQPEARPMEAEPRETRLPVLLSKHRGTARAPLPSSLSPPGATAGCPHIHGSFLLLSPLLMLFLLLVVTSPIPTGLETG